MWKEAFARQLTHLSSYCSPASQLLPAQESIVNYHVKAGIILKFLQC